MTKKKKAKRGLSGQGTSTSPSSSASSHSSGASKQASDKTSASSPPIKLDLAAANVDGSVDLPTSDLQLEPRATVHIESASVEAPVMENSNLSPLVTSDHDAANDTPVSPSAQAAAVANPELETLANHAEPQAPSPKAPLVAKETSAPATNPEAEDTPAPENNVELAVEKLAEELLWMTDNLRRDGAVELFPA
uniref:Uncharacterized protein n=1 Tax=Brassica campestris TaxID=3711 RepID=M4FAX6_BRACM